MAIYNNFLNTPYDQNIPTIVIGNVRNYVDVPKSDKAFIIYCNPIDLRYFEFVSFFRRSPMNDLTGLKKEISFGNKRIFDMKLNLQSVFTAMQCEVNNDVCKFSQPDNSINIQKFFSPYYLRTSYKTQYWSLLTYSELLVQLNLLFDNPINDLLTNVFNGLRLELTYDLYCPYYDYPIRFVFQYIVK